MMHVCPHPVCRCFDEINKSWKVRNQPYMPYQVEMRLEPMHPQTLSAEGDDWFRGTATWSDDDGKRTFETSAKGIDPTLELLKIGLLEFGKAITEAERRKGNPYV